MEKIIIRGGKPLCGEVTVSGAKNAALAILSATLLSDGTCKIENIPNISDASNIIKILSELGASVKYLNKSTVEICTKGVRTHIVPYEMTKTTRGASYFMGALLGRFNKALVAPPGGCDFGVRPIDLHEKGFRLLGARVETAQNGLIQITADKLSGTGIYLDYSSVGATINIMLAAVRAEGTTIIDNAAKEPHIVDLANFLNSMGADIRGAGTDVIKIHGVAKLGSTSYTIIPDQIEAGTYMVAAAATGGNVLVRNIIPKHLESISAKLEEAGAVITEYDEDIRVTRTGPLNRCNVKTMPHPGFPTDMQPQIVTMLAVAEGTSMITESVFDNRYKYVEYLNRMGAQIKVDGKIAVVEGVEKLTSAPLKAVDLRAGAAMIIGGLIAHGVTEIDEVKNIYRGYEDVIEKFSALGADIKRVVEQENVNTAGVS